MISHRLVFLVSHKLVVWSTPLFLVFGDCCRIANDTVSYGTVAALPIALVHSCLLSGTGSWCHRILPCLLLCLCVL